MTDHEEKAVALFYKGYNCAQAVFCAFAEDMGINEERAFALSSSFGGGMGRMRQVCGTLSGAFMALGYFFGNYPPGDDESKSKLYGRVRELAGSFAREAGSTICAELLRAAGQDPSPGGTPQKRDGDFYKKRKVCVDSVALSARLLEAYLNDHRDEINATTPTDKKDKR